MAVGKGEPLPKVTLDGPEGPVSLERLRGGRPLVVAFYVEDGTPSCSAQLSALGADFPLIEELGGALVAISVDSVESQRAFSASTGFPFPLLSDWKLEATRTFGVQDDTGKRSRRAVFVSDGAGTIVEAMPHYNPASLSQYQAIFAALGMEIP